MNWGAALIHFNTYTSENENTEHSFLNGSLSVSLECAAIDTFNLSQINSQLFAPMGDDYDDVTALAAGSVLFQHILSHLDSSREQARGLEFIAIELVETERADDIAASSSTSKPQGPCKSNHTDIDRVSSEHESNRCSIALHS